MLGPVPLWGDWGLELMNTEAVMNRSERRKADKESGVHSKEYKAAQAINDEFRRAKDLHQSGQLAEAEASYKGLLKSVPGQPDVLFALGMLNLQAGDQASGEHHLRSSLATEPRQAHVLKELGRLQYRTDQFAAAEASFQESLEYQPRDQNVWFDLGSSQLKQGKIDAAITNFEKSIEINGEYAMAVYNIGRCHDARSDYPTAEGFYRKALELTPDAYPAMVDLARCLGMTDRWDEALAAAGKLNDTHASIPEAMYILAWAQENSGATEDAEETYRDILDMDPNHIQAKLSLARLTGEGLEDLPEGV